MKKLTVMHSVTPILLLLSYTNYSAQTLVNHPAFALRALVYTV